jgi:hypothetical protein
MQQRNDFLGVTFFRVSRNDSVSALTTQILFYQNFQGLFIPPSYPSSVYEKDLDVMPHIA